MYEDLGDHGGIYDGGDDRQGAAAVGAVFNIDSEHPPSPWPANLSLAFGAPGKPGTGMLPAWRPEDGMIWGGSLALGASMPWKRATCAMRN
jgi:hypothetical protein